MAPVFVKLRKEDYWGQVRKEDYWGQVRKEDYWGQVRTKIVEDLEGSVSIEFD